MTSFFLWAVGGSHPRYMVSSEKPEFACSPVLKEGAPTEKEAQKTLPMSAWHESVEATNWKDAVAVFRKKRMLF